MNNQNQQTTRPLDSSGHVIRRAAWLSSAEFEKRYHVRGHFSPYANAERLSDGACVKVEFRTVETPDAWTAEYREVIQ